MSDAALVEVTDLTKTFSLRGGQLVRAVDGVSLSIRRGQTLGLVGESGSGKTTIGRCILRLIRPDGGNVRFDGQDVGSLAKGQMRQLRSRMQVVFQDPHGSLNRRQSIRKIITAPLVAHHAGGSRKERTRRVSDLLDLVQLPAALGERRPAELSGGQAQRVAIARALALQPEFVVLDEAVSALDVSVRAQILNLLSSLQAEFGLTYLFISHDLGVVRYLSQDIAVMYQGKLVETGHRDQLFKQPQHSYTRTLLAAVPVADPARQRARIRATETADTARVGDEPGAAASVIQRTSEPSTSVANHLQGETR